MKDATLVILHPDPSGSSTSLDPAIFEALERAGMHPTPDESAGRRISRRRTRSVHLVQGTASADTIRALARSRGRAARLVIDLRSMHPLELDAHTWTAARRAAVVICRDLGQAMAAGAEGVPLHRVHIVPTVYRPLRPDEIDTAATWARTRRLPLESLTLVSRALAGDAFRCDPEQLPVSRMDPSGPSETIVRGLVAVGATVVTTADDLDLDPWIALSSGRLPILAPSPDVTPATEELARRFARLKAAAFVPDWQARPRAVAPTDDRLIALARGRHSPEAVVPRYVHALATARAT